MTFETALELAQAAPTKIVFRTTINRLGYAKSSSILGITPTRLTTMLFGEDIVPISTMGWARLIHADSELGK